MIELLASLPNFTEFLDFEKLIKRNSIYFVQGRISFLINEIKKEFLYAKLNFNNETIFNKIIKKELEEAKDYSGGDLVEVKVLVEKILNQKSFDLKSNLQLKHEDKYTIRQILHWAPDSDWDYNLIYEKVKLEIDNKILYGLRGNQFRRYMYGILYQEGIKNIINNVFGEKEALTQEGKEINAVNKSESTSHEKKETKITKSKVKGEIETEYYTKKEVATLIGVHYNTISNYTKLGKLKCYEISKSKHLYKKSEVKAKLEELKNSKYKRYTKY